MIQIIHKMNNLNATILEIQRMSTEDGPGLRTTIFFKGCPLHCSWCHNPESIALQPQIQWIGSKCIGCHTCLDTCQQQSLSIGIQGILINRQICHGCGQCVEECPSTAMELLGKNWFLQDLFDEVLKDKIYFEKSDQGGITLSGGEPTMQTSFAAAFLQKLKQAGIHTALDTCGLYSRASINALLPFSDLVLYDLKEINPDKHIQFTGISNQEILENLIYVSDYIKKYKSPEKLWIRTPIIPGTTDTNANINGIGRFIADNLGNSVQVWELCAFNNLCRDKYLRLGLDWSYKRHALITKECMQELTQIAASSGVNPKIVLKKS